MIDNPLTHTAYRNPTPPMRAGSQDAFEKPSMVQGKPIPYKAPIAGCVGVLKDRSPNARYD